VNDRTGLERIVTKVFIENPEVLTPRLGEQKRAGRMQKGDTEGCWW
jgi:hypothetical protein